MKLRPFIQSGLVLCCLAVISAAVVQHRQIARLKAAELEIRTESAANHGPVNGALASVPSSSATPLDDEELRELMRLRSEVHRQRLRKQELGGVQQENDSLRAQLGNAPTNTSAVQVKLPPGYIRRRDAQFVGFGTPEAALQSFLWGLANRDTNILTQAMEGIEKEFAGNSDEFWRTAGSLPGLAVTATEKKSDTEVDLQVEILPGEAQTIHARRVGADWKLHE